MQTEQRIWVTDEGWQLLPGKAAVNAAQLVLLFGDLDILRDADIVHEIKQIYPEASIMGCSAGGTIHGAEIADRTVIATAIQFDRTYIKIASYELMSPVDSQDAGEFIAQELLRDDLCHVFALSDGLHVDGDALTRGFSKHLPKHISVTGGLAGDRAFTDSLVIADAPARNRLVAAVGFYGDHLQCGCGCVGGWHAFGPTRRVTKAFRNILYEVDGEPALDLYKRYLGDMAHGLPGTAVYFPLNLQLQDSNTQLVRTVLSVDEENGALIFGGEIPNHAIITLMKANVNRLVDGAWKAGEMSISQFKQNLPELSLLVSCAARKMVLKQRTEEETEAVRDALSGMGCQAGFYSFGEICPPPDHSSTCEFHNQTMTITTFSERAA